MKQIIFTADDFGLCTEVNEAVERAHREGALSAASLMVGGPAASDAIARARRCPDLRVGLHLTLVDGRPLLPPEAVPSLVDASGAFSKNLVTTGVQWFFSPAARRDLRREIHAQFEAFRATGFRLDHVNAHNHMHMHPTVLNMIVEVGANYGLKAVRLPYEPPGGLLAPWMWNMRRTLARAGVRYNDRIAGLRISGHMTTDRVLGLLDRLEDGVTEFYFHPATAATPQLEAEAAGYDRKGELDALLSPRVRERIAAMSLKPMGFSDLC